jgi:hypothetical protein
LRKEGPNAFDGSTATERKGQELQKKRLAREKNMQEAFTKEDRELLVLREEWKARLAKFSYDSQEYIVSVNQYQVAEDAFWASSQNPRRRGLYMSCYF